MSLLEDFVPFDDCVHMEAGPLWGKKSDDNGRQSLTTLSPFSGCPDSLGESHIVVKRDD